jgi:hypothetical protein
MVCGLALLMLGTSIGCKLPARFAHTESGALKYERANIVYDVNGQQRPIPLGATSIKPVGYDQPMQRSDNGEVNWASAKLSIQYPHPDGDRELARAILRLSGKPVSTQITKSDAVAGDEIWVLDFPRQQLDLLLSDLAGSGFFEEQQRQEPGTHLDVQVDWGRTRKPWTPEPRLDHFVARVYNEGRLGGFVAAQSPSH